MALAAAGLALGLPALALADVDGDDAVRPTATPAGLVCGLTRWGVKTLSDPSAGAVDLAPRATTVDRLGSIPAPTITERTPRLARVETSTFRVPARLVAERRQRDHDIHLIVADPATGATMITELPDPACAGPLQSAQRPAMAAARATLERACGPAPAGRFRRLSGTATLAGVGFLDEPHHPAQPGAAPNSIELHPILALTGLSCRSRGFDPPSAIAAGD